MISVPKEIVNLEQISPGELVEVEIKKAKKDWFGIFPELKPFTKEERMHSHYD